MRSPPRSMLRGGLTRRSARYVLVAPVMVAALLLVSSSSYQATRWIPIEQGLRPDATGPPSTLPPALSSEALLLTNSSAPVALEVRASRGPLLPLATETGASLLPASNESAAATSPTAVKGTQAVAASPPPRQTTLTRPHALPNTAKLNPPTVLYHSLDPCAEASGTGKVALLFLTMGQMPHAETWRLWMASAAGKLPKVNVYCNPNVDVVQEACQGLTPLEAASLLPEDVLAWQHLYSVYVHAAPSVNVSSIPPLFRKHLIETRVETQWGSISLVYAARLLIWEAYKDPMNERFVHLSPSDIPLYDPVTFHYQLMSESLSRTSACVSTSLDLYRWNSAMTVRPVCALSMAASHAQQRASACSFPLLRQSPKLKRRHWRKASQWFMLTREHAGLVLDDTHIFQQFEAYCYAGWDPVISMWRNCYADEHYLPTLFASLGLQQHENCNAWGIAAVDWSKGGAHPRSYRSWEVTGELLGRIRKARTCESDAMVSRAQLRYATLGTPPSNSSDIDCEAPPTEGMSSVCPMTARKFPLETRATVSSVFLDCNNSELRLLDHSICTS